MCREKGIGIAGGLRDALAHCELEGLRQRCVLARCVTPELSRADSYERCQRAWAIAELLGKREGPLAPFNGFVEGALCPRDRRKVSINGHQLRSSRLRLEQVDGTQRGCQRFARPPEVPEWPGQCL